MSRPVAVILAGGQSRRFGRDKAQVRVGERSMLEHVVAAAQPVAAAVVVVGGTGPLPPGVAHVADLQPAGGPVQAVVAATRAWPGQPWLLLGCDLPYLDSRLLAWLSQPLDPPFLARIPCLGGRAQYLVSAWHPAAAAAFETAWAAGCASLREVAASLPHHAVDEAALAHAGLDPRCLQDVDTPADLRPGGDSG